MSTYELTAIIRPDIAEEDVPQVQEKLSALVGENAGSVSQVNHWGRRRLAYPIKRFGEGNYVIVRLESEPERIGGIKSNLNLAEELLRYLLVRVDK